MTGGINMSKTITVRINEDIYDLFKKAADGERRSISNFVEFATIQYVSSEISITDDEMNEILTDKKLCQSLQDGLKEVKQGNYKIVS